MDLRKRRQLIKSHLSVGAPPPGEAILTDADRDQLRRARELNFDPAPEEVSERGNPVYDYTPLASLIEALHGRNSGFDTGPLFDPVEIGRFCRMRPAEAYRELLIIQRRGQFGPVTTVDVHEFFDGNDDTASIGPGLDGSRSTFTSIRDTLMSVAALPAVQAVGVEIDELPNLDHRGDDDMWPRASRVFIWILSPPKDFRKALRPLAADSIDSVPLRTARPPGGMQLPPRTKLLAVVWD